MADFEILVGAKPEANFTELVDQINKLFEKANKTLEIKVKATGDAEVLADLQKQISSLRASMNASGSSALNSNLSGISKAAQTASSEMGELSRRVSEYIGDAKNASTVTSTYKNSMTGVSTTVKETANAEGTLQVATTKVTETFKASATAAKEKAAAEKQATQAANEQASAEKSAENELRKYQNAASQFNAKLTQIQSALGKYTQAEHSRTQSSRDAYAALKNEEQAMLNFKSKVDSATASEEEIRAATASANDVLKASEQTIKANGDATKSLTSRFSELATKFGSWLTVSQAIMLAVRALKQMVSVAIEVDTAMTELKKVTDETDATYSQFLDNASSRASKLGATLSDVVTATADFARLGYNLSDATDLADAAIIYKNVGDNIEDISTASESIIATMQAFGIEADDAMSIVDKFNEVGNNFAIGSDGIGEALTRSAAAMNAAGNTLDETIALTTAANTVVQNPESVGEFAPNNTVTY